MYTPGTAEAGYVGAGAARFGTVVGATVAGCHAGRSWTGREPQG